MRRRLAAPLILALLPPAGGAAGADRLPGLLAELRKSSHGPYGCFSKEASVLRSAGAEAVALEYQRTRGLPTLESARALLASRIEYDLRPSEAAFEQLRRAVTDAGATEAAAEDVCRCLYYGRGDERPEQMASIPPPAVGLFWAGRVLHEKGRSDQALDFYRRALEADPSNPRTRLFHAIALINERRAKEAFDVLARVPPSWAPEPVTYWRARALLEMGEHIKALALLDSIPPAWHDAPTVPDASIGSAPVQAPVKPACLLGRVRAELGDEAGARALLEKDDECRHELARLELRVGRPFAALLAFVEDVTADDLLHLEALSQLKACPWARRELASWEGMCRADDSRSTECPRLPEVRERVLRACPAEPVQADALPVDEALAARLRAPRLMPFEERGVPGTWRWAGRRREQRPSIKKYPGLSGQAVVAVSPAGRRMFAVSVSQDVDPRGEVSSGGYWLHLSSTRGRTWEGPYYLGFAEQFPYVVATVSRVPPFEGGRLNIEVERREVDESTITFPPVALRAKNVETDLYLSVDLAAVVRDSDGEGLTDLLEEKLALDPESPDTDGDGLADAVDPLPLQPRSDAESGERSQVMAAVLPHLFSGLPPVQQTAAEGDEGSAMSFQPRPFAAARTLFVAGHGVLPHGVPLRIVTLTPAALEDYRRKFGATYPMELPDIAFDHGRTRALIRYDFGWRGGTLLAERKGGRWEVTSVGEWIT